MTTANACPQCGTAMREIVWGYGTIADVADAGDVVIGGCVVDVDPDGRVAAFQCPACGTRTDAAGLVLERPEPAAPSEHPFAVSFSSPPAEPWEVTVPQSQSQFEPASPEERPAPTQEPFGEAGQGFAIAGSAPFVDEDFGAAATRDAWRERIEPYSSREDELPAPSVPAPEHVEPYASRDDALPERGEAARDGVAPYASRDDALPDAPPPAPERVEPYASRGDAPERAAGEWRPRIEPFAS